MAVTVCPAPTGVSVAVQLAVPALTVATHREREPDEKVTVPDGIVPAPVTAAEYVTAEPYTAAAGFASTLTDAIALPMTSSRVAEATWGTSVEASLTVTVTVPENATSGVPLTVPPGESDRPAGRAPGEIDQLYGAVPPEAVSTSEQNFPTVQERVAGGVMASLEVT